jgi:hypothetical protein
MESIGNSLEKYIDKIEPRDHMFTCAIIYVEFDLEKGILEENPNLIFLLEILYNDKYQIYIYIYI